jgi:hypothetical protein
MKYFVFYNGVSAQSISIDEDPKSLKTLNDIFDVLDKNPSNSNAAICDTEEEVEEILEEWMG